MTEAQVRVIVEEMMAKALPEITVEVTPSPDLMARAALFQLRGGRVGLMGEDGPEAVMPLERPRRRWWQRLLWWRH